MNTTENTTQSTSLKSALNAGFEPMTEEQISSIRGGTQWPDWIVDLVEDFVDDAVSYLNELNDMLILNSEEEFWGEVEGDLQNNGYNPPSWDDVMDSIGT